MGQITIYLDKNTEKKMRVAAKSHKMSISKWITTLISEKISTNWSQDIINLVGSWEDDFPSIEEIRSSAGQDYPRKPL
ncbi:CopG family transcriptional regulator [bacterium]|nr:CopG family transcriptional regulator [bacterium]